MGLLKLGTASRQTSSLSVSSLLDQVRRAWCSKPRPLRMSTHQLSNPTDEHDDQEEQMLEVADVPPRGDNSDSDD